MQLYHHTLKRSTAMQFACFGNFSGSNDIQFVVSKTTQIQLWKIIDDNPRITFHQQIYGIIRSLTTFKVPGINKDFLLLGSDSGKIAIIQYSIIDKRFNIIDAQAFGKSGCRRVVAGQLLACDKRGRAFIVASSQKQRLGYRIDRKGQFLKLSSPLQCDKQYTILLDLVSINQIEEQCKFATLQINYGDPSYPDSLINTDKKILKTLAILQFDLGLNTISTKQEIRVPDSATGLLAISQSVGVLVLCLGFVMYYSKKKSLNCSLPRPNDLPIDRQSMIVCHTVVKTKQQTFYLLQNQLGDIYQLFLILGKDGMVVDITIQYFETISICSNLTISKAAHILATGQRSDNVLYKFVMMGGQSISLNKASENSSLSFQKRMHKLNIKQINRIQNMSCITDILVSDLCNQGAPQIYVSCAQSNDSKLLCLRSGLYVQELGGQDFQSKPVDIFALGNPCQKILLSYLAQTVVLGVISGGIRQLSQHPFEDSQQTLMAFTMAQGITLQVFLSGFRAISSTIRKWQTKGRIKKASCNSRQLAIALQGGDLIYFQIVSGQLKQFDSCQLDSQVRYMDIAQPLPQKVRSNFIAIGLLNHTVRILSLIPGQNMKRVSVQSIADLVQSIVMIRLSSNQAYQQQFIYIGTNTGKLIRSTVDNISGNLSQTKIKEIGNKAIQLSKINVLGVPGLVAVSNRTWLIYNYIGQLVMHPLSYLQQQRVKGFPLKNSQGLICLSQKKLRIIKVIKYGQSFYSQSLSLKCNPKKILQMQKNKVVVIQGQHRADAQQGKRKGCIGQWLGLIRVVSAYPKLKTEQVINLQTNQTPITACKVQNSSSFVISSVINLQTKPTLTFTTSTIRVYKFNSYQKLQLIHSTEVQDIVFALSSWQNRLLAGVGHSLRSYQIGVKRVLRKAQLKGLQSNIKTIQVSGGRVFTSQISDSFHVYRYQQKEQTFIEIADDILQRWSLNSCLLDHQTIAGVDKFQTFYVSRAPPHAQQDIDSNPNSYKFRWQNGNLNGAPFKMDQICSFYLGDVATCLLKTKLSTSGPQIIIYGTAGGALGVFSPFNKRQDHDFFVHLQLNMRKIKPPLLGRDHLAYRSFYSVCKGVIDGDLCEQFVILTDKESKEVQQGLEYKHQQILNRLQQIRHSV